MYDKIKDDSFVDFRVFKPISIFCIDFVKHSNRIKSDIFKIQEITTTVFEESIKRLNLSKVYFNYTGDGYFCSFTGDESARILDFINISLIKLKNELAKYSQSFRGGIDYGIAHLNQNSLTGTLEHFDLPGIQASRLCDAAQPDQILCTETIYNVFYYHYQQMFSPDKISVQTKDREISAYQVIPFDFSSIKEYFSNYFFQEKIDDITLSPNGERKKIMIVDDEEMVLEISNEMISTLLPEYQIEAVGSVKEALEKFECGKYALVITDLIMPPHSGIELTKKLIEIDKELPVVMMTGFGSESSKDFFNVGGVYFFTKPFSVQILSKIINPITQNQNLFNNVNFRAKIIMLSDDLGEVLFLFQEASDEFHEIMDTSRKSDDIAFRLLRHKAKQIIVDFLETIQPGNDIANSLKVVRNHLFKLNKLLQKINSAKNETIEIYFKDFLEDTKKLYPQSDISVKIETKEKIKLANPTIITLLIFELIDNALFATKYSGTINVTVSLLPTSNLILIKVCDSGPGIPEEMREYVFKKSFSTKGSDRGLGLMLLYEVVKNFKGTINYEYDSGSCFTISIPLN